MAKKKAAKSEDDIDDDDFGDFEDEEIETLYPKIKKEEKKPEKQKISDVETRDSEEEEVEEDYEEFLEEEPELPTYKFLDLKIEKGNLPNDYIVKIIGQSHGFCNILVKHLLEIKGVNMAAYKVTGLEPSKIFIRLENGGKIKNILHQGIENVRAQVAEIEKLFLKIT